jgi:threonine/homoserine/homoserine lactone efflux protein
VLPVLLLILPFGFASALSPVMLTEQTVLLSSEGGRRAGRRYAAGAFLVALLYVSVLVLFGQVISLPQEPKLDSTLDIALGAFLVVVALLIHRGRSRASQEKAEPKKSHRSFGPNRAFGFGVFSMATNFTTLALLVPGSKLIAAGNLLLPERALLVLVLAGLAATPAWLPVALTEAVPGPARRGLDWMGSMISNHGRQVIVGLVGGLGLLLILRGVSHAAGL